MCKSVVHVSSDETPAGIPHLCVISTPSSSSEYDIAYPPPKEKQNKTKQTSN